MKKAVKRVVFFALIELPLTVAASHVSIRSKQLFEKHTDEEIKAMAADKAASIHQGLILKAAARMATARAKAADASASNGATETHARPRSPWDPSHAGF